MTATLPRPKGAPPTVTPSPVAPQRRALDCDVCIVGDGLLARALGHRLAALGRDVVHVAVPADPALPLDPVLAPGYALPAHALVEQLGPADAAELWHLSREATARGRDLMDSLDLASGPKGALLAARPDAAHALRLEQDAISQIAPGASRLIGARDLEGLLGTTTFPAAIGLVPAVRVSARDLGGALARRATEAGVRELATSEPPSFDLKGLRKYVDVGAVRVRAFEVVLCGEAAMRQGVPQVAQAVQALHVAAGRMATAQGSSEATLPAFAGRVDAFGGNRLAYHVDEAGLTLAVETAWTTRMSWSAARILRHQAWRLFPDGLAGALEDARGYEIQTTRRRMPLVGAVDKGLWVAGALGLQPVSVHLMAAELLADAIALKDDRIQLLRPFLAPAPKRAFVVLRDMAAYWRARLSARLAQGAAENRMADNPPLDAGAPDVRAPDIRAPEGDGLPAGRGGRLARMREGARGAPRPAPGGARGPSGAPRSEARRGPRDSL